MNVLIGSRAMRLHFPDFPREPHDTDFATNEYTKRKTIRGADVVEYLPLPEICSRYSNFTRDMKTATPSELLTLKMSHIFWPIHWEKTMFDIVFLLNKGVKVDQELLYKLLKKWDREKGVPRRANLNMSVQDFFTNGIKDGHAHDALHEILRSPPTYTKVLKDPSGVAIEEEKYWQLSHEDKLNIVREECYVMAYERGVRSGKKDYRDAYREQLRAWILEHAPSRDMALFAVEHYDELRKPAINYKEVIEKIKHGK